MERNQEEEAPRRGSVCVGAGREKSWRERKRQAHLSLPSLKAQQAHQVLLKVPVVPLSLHRWFLRDALMKNGNICVIAVGQFPRI
jgi:hypothetical protein